MTRTNFNITPDGRFLLTVQDKTFELCEAEANILALGVTRELDQQKVRGENKIELRHKPGYYGALALEKEKTKQLWDIIQTILAAIPKDVKAGSTEEWVRCSRKIRAATSKLRELKNISV